MKVEVTAAGPAEVEADALALVAGGLLVRKLDPLFEGRLTRSAPDADPITVVQVGRELRARRLVLVATDGVDPDDLRTAAARAVRACRGTSTVAWALDDSLPMAETRQLQAIVEGAVLGSYDAGRWKSEAGKPAVERFVVCGAGDELARATAGPRSSRAGRTSPASSSTRRERNRADRPGPIAPHAIRPARRRRRRRRRRPPGARRRRPVEHGAAAARRPAPRARGRAARGRGSRSSARP